MANIIDYLHWRGDFNLAERPFNDVDCLVLCRLSYLPFEDVVPADFAAVPVSLGSAVTAVLAQTCGDSPQKQVRIKDDIPFMQALLQSPRFTGLTLSGYVNRLDREQQKQFSAVTVLLPDGPFLAYRGTDGTLVGWKEDFNMSFDTAIPAQQDAVAYLADAAAAFGGSIRLGGHSKGGNLAVYAAAFCAQAVQARILSVRSNDGPGFSKSVLDAPGYDAISARAHTYLPQSSVVGMLMEHEEAYTVVHSTYVGLAQHDVYSWELQRDTFITVDSLTNSSQLVDRTLKEWLTEMTPEKREKLVDGVYALLSVSDATTLREMWSGKNALAILKTVSSADDETKELVSQAISILGKSMEKSLPAVLENAFGKYWPAQGTDDVFSTAVSAVQTAAGHKPAPRRTDAT